MKLMICIANQKYGPSIVKHLSQKKYRITKLASTGGFLKEGNETLLIGANEEHINSLKSEIKDAVLTLEKEKGWEPKANRFTLFVVDGQNYLPLP